MEVPFPGKPLISVIITSYNYLHYITDAIDSAREQTYPNVEIVIVDNASTDGTVPALHERYAADPRVRIYQNETNLGEIYNSNRGFELTTGEFVMWLSADDWMFPRHLERLYAVFDREPSIDVVYSGAYFADDQRRVYGQRMEQAIFPFPYVDARDELVEMFTAICPLCWPTALWRRSVFVEVGPEDPDGGIVATDWEMQIRIAIAGKRFAYLPEPSLAIRIHDAQTTGFGYLSSEGRVTDFLGILEKYIDHPGMARLRGREGSVLGLLKALVEDCVRAGAEISAPVRARVDAMSSILYARTLAYEPARVHESRISVILPVARSPQLAARAIDSIVQQTFPNVEIVLIDSSPFSLQGMLDAHPARDRISYVRSPVPLPPGRARNCGLRMARGEYLAFLGEDNTYHPEHLATLADTIVQRGAAAAASSSRLILEHAQAFFLKIEELGSAEIFRGPNDPQELSLVADALPIDATLVYRRARDRGASFGEGALFLDDWDFLIALERVEPIAFTGRMMLDVRVRIDFSTALGANLLRYVSILDAVYASNPAPHLARQRTAHRAATERAIAGVAAGGGITARAAVDLLGTLAGQPIRASL